MAVRLSKGQKVNLRKEAPNLKRICIGLGWDPVEEEMPQTENKKLGFVDRLKAFLGIVSEQPAQSVYQKNDDVDIDASVYTINEKGEYEKVVCYYNLKEYDGAIKHHGDNLTGEGESGEDDERIDVKLNEIPKKICQLSIIINIYNAYGRRQDFSQVKNCFVHVTDMDSGKELVWYDVDGNFEGMTGIFVADLKRSGNTWEFEAKGEGVRVADIDEMISMKCK